MSVSIIASFVLVSLLIATVSADPPGFGSGGNGTLTHGERTTSSPCGHADPGGGTGSAVQAEGTRASEDDGPHVVLLRSSELRTGEKASISFAIDDTSFDLVAVRVVSNDRENKTSQVELRETDGGNNWTVGFKVDRYSRRVLLLILVDNGYGTRLELTLGWFDVRDVIPPTASMVSGGSVVKGAMNRFSFMVDDNRDIFNVSLNAVIGQENRTLDVENPQSGVYGSDLYVGLLSPDITLRMTVVDTGGNVFGVDFPYYMEAVDMDDLFALGHIEPSAGEWMTLNVTPVRDGGDLQSVSISFDGSDPFYVTSELTSLQVPANARTMCVGITIRDRVDNTITFWIDREVRDPIEPNVCLEDLCPICGETLEFSPSVTDNVALVWTRVAVRIDDGKPYELFRNNGVYCLDVPDSATRVDVMVWACDEAGNQAYTTFPFETLDRIAPTVSDIRWALVGKDLTIEANATDNRAVSCVLCHVNGKEWNGSFEMVISDEAYLGSIALPSSGPYWIEVHATDGYGNVGIDTVTGIRLTEEKDDGFKVLVLILGVLAFVGLLGAFVPVILWSRKRIEVDPSEIKKMREDVVPPERNALFRWGPDRYHHGERAPDWDLDPYFLYIRPGDAQDVSAPDQRPRLPPWRRSVR